MPLLTLNQRINARLAERAKNIAAHTAASINEANGMVQDMLDLDDVALTSWLNSQPSAETLALFGSHGQLGEFLNGAITTAAGVLAASGLDAPAVAVDVRTVPEKLADKGRAYAFADGVFSVTTSQPEPTPEPEPEA